MEFRLNLEEMQKIVDALNNDARYKEIASILKMINVKNTELIKKEVEANDTTRNKSKTDKK